MAFYGRVTNESKTSMTFDRIYQNRVDMDNNASTDGVFTGRFVLIDYDRDPSKSPVSPIATIGGDYNVFDDDKVYDYYISYYREIDENEDTFKSEDIQTDQTTNTLMLYHVSMIEKAQDDGGKCTITKQGPVSDIFNEYDIFKVHMLKHNGENPGWPESAFEQDGETIPEENCMERIGWVTDYVENDLVDIRYFMIAPIPNNPNDYQFLDISNLINVDETDDNVYYIRNYNIDKIKYGNKLGRGYDSTVWRKVIAEDGTGYYVMLAELNSVVPTFDITAEAPSSGEAHQITEDYSIYDPIKPHFDEDTTNVYYNLHMGTPWGFKIKPVTTTMNESEEPETDLPTDDAQVGAIYVNAKGFDRYKPLNISMETRLSRESENKVKVTPTGISGQMYFDHNSNTFKTAKDQQEMQINLPTIGDAVATIWDALYGNYDYWRDKYIKAHEREDGFNVNEIKDEDIIRDIEIAWYEASRPGRYNGPRLVSVASDKQIVYTPNQINNLSGAMHTLYDLIGQNIMVFEITTEELAEITDTDDANERLEKAIQKKAADTDLDLIYYCTNNRKFYFKGYETYIEELRPGEGNNDSIISAGSGYKPFHGQLIDRNNKKLYKQPSDRVEHYYLLGEDDELQPSVTYYELKLNKFTNATKTTIKDFDTLVSEGVLYEFNATNAEDTLSLIHEEDNIDSTITTTTLPSGNTATRFYILENDSITPLQIKAYFPNETGLFVNYQNIDINTYPMLPNPDEVTITVENAKQCIFYQRVQTNEVSHPINPDGSIDYSRTIYTTVLEPKAITAELAEYLTENADFATTLQENGYRVSGLPTIHKWPNTSRDMAQGVWTQNANGDYVITTNPPALQSSAVNAKIAEVLRGVQTYKLVVSPADNFYIPNSFYWGAANDLTETLDSDLYEIYRKITPRNNDDITTYKISEQNNGQDVPLPEGGLVNSAIPGVNGLDNLGLEDNSAYTAYFIPGQLYENIGNDQYIAANTYSANTTYYKRREVVVLSDPLGEFNEGEVWNTELTLSDVNANRGNNQVILGEKLARPHLYELEGYSRDDNTINGWILYLNRLLGNPGDEATRDRTTVKGVINYLNDKLDKIDNAGENQLIVSDSNGHLNGGTIVNTTSQWINASVTNPIVGGAQHPQFNIEHVTNNFATSNANSSSVFSIGISGNNLQIQLPIIDAAGHVIGATNPSAQGSTNAVALPSAYATIIDDNNGSITASSTGDSIAITTSDAWLTTAVSTDGLIIAHNNAQTAIVTVGETQDALPHFGESFKVLEIGTDNKGHVSTITEHSVTMPTCTLTDTVANGADVITQLTLNASTGAFSTTRANIGSLLLTDYTTTSASAVSASDTLNTAIAKLQAQITANDSANLVNNFTTTSTGNVMTTMVLNDGTITGSYNNIGALQLTGYDLTNNGTVETAISANDTLNTAIQRLEYRLNGIEVPVTGAVIHGSNPSDIVDLVQSDGMIVLNRASNSSWGLVKLSENNDPGAGYVVITGKDANTTSDVVCYVPNIQNNGAGTIKAQWLPDASTASKGAVVVDDVITDSSTNPAQSAAIKAYVDGQITNILSTLGFRTETYDYIDDLQSGGADYQAHDTGSFTLTASSINGYTPVRVVTASIDDNLFHITSTSVVETTDEVIVTINYEVLESYSTQSDPSHHATVLFEINS